MCLGQNRSTGNPCQLGLGRKGTWAGQGSVRVLVPLRVPEVLKGAGSEEWAEPGNHWESGFSVPWWSCVFTSAGGSAVPLAGPELGHSPALPCPSGGHEQFLISFFCLQGGTSCIVWATAASCIQHTKIKNLQMFGLSFAPEINLLVKECVRRVRQQDSLEELFFSYLQQQCPSTHTVLILKGIVKYWFFL